jgi:hypothetical protein
VDKPPKSAAYFPRVARVKKGILFWEHPGRHLAEPFPSFSVSRTKLGELENGGFRFAIKRGKFVFSAVCFSATDHIMEFFRNKVTADGRAKYAGVLIVESPADRGESGSGEALVACELRNDAWRQIGRVGQFDFAPAK